MGEVAYVDGAITPAIFGLTGVQIRADAWDDWVMVQPRRRWHR